MEEDGAQGRSVALGAVIRARRLARGRSQENLAEWAGDGLGQSDVSRLERGRVGLPHRRRLERIAAALDLPLGELLHASGGAGAAGAFGGERAVHRATDLLVVHHEPVAAEALAALLVAEGQRVRIAGDAGTAATEADGRGPALVVADAALSGVESFARRLRERARPIPVVLLGAPPDDLGRLAVASVPTPLVLADRLAAVEAALASGR